MVSKSHAKRRQDIKTKLMAAIAMLLVSSIMMVSSTYAWFTLSTAPEVTGINTQVGANGNLEMALMPMNGWGTEGFGITSSVGDSEITENYKKNITWGNLINLASNSIYRQYYPNFWLGAGVCITLAILAFNFVGDGLRDAFDPKMKR